MSRLTVQPGATLQGTLTVPGDKSISHRAAILGALAVGPTEITGFLTAEDTLNTARVLQAMGVRIDGLGGPDMLVDGVGIGGLQAPQDALDMGNSGTGMRLLMGVLAGHPFPSTLVGDASLSTRPMDRIARPLGLMGIEVTGRGERCTPPVTVHGGRPRPITYESPVASAQVKSAVLLAGLHAHGQTTVIEPAPSRDHTERMLQAFGAKVSRDGLAVGVTGPGSLAGRKVSVPGDFSSAAFFIAAGLLCPGSEIVLHNVLLNPTRAAMLDVLARMGADVEVLSQTDCAGEPVGNLCVRASTLTGTVISGDEVPSLIDEVPVLAVLASQASGVTEIRDAAELRVKESDRLATVARGLTAMGADVRELEDGLIVHGPSKLTGATIETQHDHRIAMSFTVAGLTADSPTTIEGTECIATSFPGFGALIGRLGATVQER